MHSLESRVAKLERRLRFSRSVNALTLLALATVVLLGATQGTPEVIRARRLEVVNATGRPLVVLQTTEFGGQVQTLGNDGVSGVTIGASSSGAFVGVRDRKPTLFPRVELSTDETGGMLAVRNWRGFAIEVDRHGLAVGHAQENGSFTRVDPRVLLGVNEHGGHIRVLSATGSEAATIRADDSGAGVISAFARNGAEQTVSPNR